MDVVVTIRSGRKTLSREVMDESLVDAHLTVAAFMYGGVSGHSAGWAHPSSGQPLQRPRATIRRVSRG